MKKIVFILLFVLISTMVFSQYEELPTKIDKAFSQKYPKAENVSWYLEEDNYRIDFELNQDNYSVIYSNDGIRIQSAKVISYYDIPKNVSSMFNKKYSEHEVSYAEYVENNKGEKFYRISSYDDNADYLISISPEGVIIDNKKIVDYSDDIEDF